jgi:SAM-dependent methyltransferase
MTRALDQFDPARDFDDDLVKALSRAKSDFLVWHSRRIGVFAGAFKGVDALIAARKNVVNAVIDTPHGHDAFLLPVPRYLDVFRAYMQNIAAGLGRAVRPDLAIIADLVAPGARVLDLGCGDGELLAHLKRSKGVNGYGLEIDPDKITGCITVGVNVIEQDLDQGLTNFPSDSFDLVVMTDTLQSVRHPDVMLDEMLRIGHECIVTFPNWRIGSAGSIWRCAADADRRTSAASLV